MALNRFFSSLLSGSFSSFLVRRRGGLAIVLLALLATSLAAPPQPMPADSHLPGLYNPVADPAAVVTFGKARFTVLTPQLLRMEWSADGAFEDRASLVFLNRRLPVPKFTRSEAGGVLTLKTNALELRYAPDGDGRFTPQNLQVQFTLNGAPAMWHPGADASGNLLGTTRTLDGAFGDKTGEPMEPGLVSRDGWAVVDDSARPLFDGNDFRFTLGARSPWPWVVQRSAGERQDWYFLGYGHDYRQALADYTRLAGKIPLAPHFAFGAWWSRYWAYSDQELDELMSGFRRNDVPLDVLVIDMEWHKTFGLSWFSGVSDQAGETKGWTGYSWNRLLFPEPETFLKKVHDEGLKATLNLHPAAGVQPWEDAYPAMAKAMGIDPATEKYVPFDITDKRFATNYLDLLHHPLERQGIDFWWLDWQQKKTTKIPGLNPTWWLNYVHFSDQARQGKRPLLFHRWGGLGNHRYQIGFSGDTTSKWDSLAFQPWFTATAANVGYAYWSHDIGGHAPGNVSPELYTRWIQFGIFSPILRTHTTKNPAAERRIWAYPEPYSDIMKGLYHRRYAMVPYLYTEARRTYDTGVAFLHPLYYDWPEAAEAYSAKNEYGFGENLLVAPVTTPVDTTTGLARQSLWLPPGEWVEVDTGTRLSGPTPATRHFSIRQIPVYAKAGSIMPLAPDMQFTGQKPLDPLIVSVLPLNDGQSSKYTLYQDAGDTRGYEVGQAAYTDLSASQKGAVLTVKVAPVRGGYPGMPQSRGYEIRLPGDWPATTVSVNGKLLAFAPKAGAVGWRFEGNTLTTIITVARQAVSAPLVVEVRRESALLARRGELNGFAGIMSRSREAYDALNQNWPFGWSSDELVDVMQTGNRLSYHPERAGAEVAHLWEVLPKAVAKVQRITTQPDEQERKDLVRRLGDSVTREEVTQKLTEYAVNVGVAKGVLSDLPARP